MVSLHTHSMYSLRDSIITPDDLVKRLKEVNQNIVAITDHGNMLSGVTLYKKLKENNIKLIIGCEFYICDDVRVKDKDSRYYHLVALCINDIGRKNLNVLISKSERPENKYYKPRIDFEMLKQNSDGLIIMSACLAGEISRYIQNDDYEKAESTVLKYKNYFGDRYYLEVQSHRDDTQVAVNKEIYNLSIKCGVKCVVTTDAHYAWEGDKDYQNKYAFNGAYKEDGEAYIDCFIQSEEEVIERLQYFEADIVDSMIQTTHEIADRCNVDMPLSAPIMPKVNTPDKYKNNREWLEHICDDGFKKKLNIDCTKKCLNDKSKVLHRNIYDDNGKFVKTIEYQLTQEEIQAYIDRYHYELDSLDRMGFLDYILLVYSYANVAKRRGIARGSGGGSLVCYLSNITNIDPIEHGLYFERFIDVGALPRLEAGEITAKELKIPDIDLDFSGESCKDVLKYLYNKYGEENVASIGKFGTNHTKGTIRDMCKVLGIDLQTEDIIAKSFESYEIDELDNLISAGEKIPDNAKEAVGYINKYPELFKYVRKLNGLPKSFGLHACFKAGTKVLTRDGYKAIEDVSIDDYVLTHKNRYKKVTNTMTTNSSSITAIDSVGLIQTQCTPDHPFFIKKRIGNRGHKYKNPEWVDASEIEKGDLIGFAINQECIIPEHSDLQTNTEKFWWVIGRYIGDGWTEYYDNRNEKRVIICCSKTSLKELNKILYKLNGLFDFRIEESRSTYKIFIKSSALFDFVQQFGKYAYGKKLTNTIIDLPNNFLLEFLNGYFSADGYVDKYKTQTIKTVSIDLTLGIEQCIMKVFKRHCGVHKISPKQETIEWRLVSSKEKYFVYFNKDKRKKERCFYDGTYIWSFVKSVSTIQENSDMYNISVDEDESYTVNNVIVHNCGKVIATRSLDEFLPSCYDGNGIRFLQGDMHDVEDVGLVKVDILGLRTLDQEYDTMEMTGKDSEYINPKAQDFSDPKVLSIFRNGDTTGIFQFSSYGMKQTLKKMNVKGIEDLAIANALYRPGAMPYIDNFCNRRNGKETFQFLNPDLEEILKNTYGIIVFQEQLIEIGRLAKIHNPDLLRKATGKKNPKLLNEVKPELEEKLKARGWTQDQFDTLWSDMLEFSKYSFNKAHAAAYAILAYITAKQKAYYPAEFFAGLCNSYLGESSFVKDNADEIIQDMDKHKVKLAPFSFRNDNRKCSVSDGNVVYGIPLIRNCNDILANSLYEIKDKQYKYFWNLLKDVYGLGAQKTQVSILIKLGFFSEFGVAKKLLRIYDLFEYFKQGEAKQIKKSKISDGDFLYSTVSKYSTDVGANGKELASFKILDMDGILNECESYILSLNIEDFDYRNQIANQKEFLGFVSLTTGIESDRPNLYVKKIAPVYRKKDNAQFGYSIIAKSIGSGKETRYTIFNKVFNKCPISTGDVINCTGYSRDGKYFTINSYQLLI